MMVRCEVALGEEVGDVGPNLVCERQTTQQSPRNLFDRVSNQVVLQDSPNTFADVEF